MIVGVTLESVKMKFRASHRFAPISSRKVRLVIDLIRRKSADEALEMLQFINNRGASMIDKVRRSAELQELLIGN